MTGRDYLAADQLTVSGCSVSSPEYSLLLKTKIGIPPPRPQLVSRSRLLMRLAEGASGPLTLISGPAGFGKTT
ncbi:MAG TPA: hypothetical protein PLD30_10465, partial [Candidatus Competibacteraceae bacterium]|nr:hypothetical protein [Candidatus Competibacteraceae bacterium]